MTDRIAPQEGTRWVVDQANAIGFDLCGVAPVDGLADLAHLPEWLAAGYAAEMKYLHDARRADPRLVLEGARSMVVVALNYNTAHPRTFNAPAATPGESPRGW
ncbi:MAG TPA: hypothetical protein VIY69_17530, partial [Candidatus Acidoferrales bacterium]